jgi:hypothetical protein
MLTLLLHEIYLEKLLYIIAIKSVLITEISHYAKDINHDLRLYLLEITLVW